MNSVVFYMLNGVNGWKNRAKITCTMYILSKISLCCGVTVSDNFFTGMNAIKLYGHFLLKYRAYKKLNKLEFQTFRIFYIVSIQTIYVTQKLHTWSRFAMLGTQISNLFSRLYTL